MQRQLAAVCKALNSQIPYIAACAAAKRATGTRNGEQLT
jgi:hypothetical protein